MSGLPGAAGLSKAVLLLDPYERQARLFPALLCLLPAMVMLITLYGDQLLDFKGVLMLLGSVGVTYLLADIARSKGKEKESELWQKWGGTPSIQVLRYRDEVFDSVSKRRYHAFLAEKIKEPFPTEEAEAADPISADKVYSAAGNWLRSATRDKKTFDLLFRENVNYGFRRNGFGVRWLGVLISLAVIGWVAVRSGLDSWKQRLGAASSPDALFGAGEVVTLSGALLMVLVWLYYFSESRVREAAFSYAQRLVLACEVFLQQASAPAKLLRASAHTRKETSPLDT